MTGMGTANRDRRSLLHHTRQQVTSILSEWQSGVNPSPLGPEVTVTVLTHYWNSHLVPGNVLDENPWNALGCYGARDTLSYFLSLSLSLSLTSPLTLKSFPEAIWVCMTPWEYPSPPLLIGTVKGFPVSALSVKGYKYQLCLMETLPDSTPSYWIKMLSGAIAP